jgi:hypothetical protein
VTGAAGEFSSYTCLTVPENIQAADVMGAAGEFSSYTCLAVLENILAANGMARPVVGKGTVKCTDSVTLTKSVIHWCHYS